MPRITLRVNGTEQVAEVEPRLLLVQFLRERLGLTGTHVGCDSSQCGACTVLLDGNAVKSCTVLAVQADGGAVLTIEGLARGSTLHPLQQAFIEQQAERLGLSAAELSARAAAFQGRAPTIATRFTDLWAPSSGRWSTVCSRKTLPAITQ